jgi:hypothetical protein
MNLETKGRQHSENLYHLIKPFSYDPKIIKNPFHALMLLASYLFPNRVIMIGEIV